MAASCYRSRHLTRSRCSRACERSRLLSRDFVVEAAAGNATYTAGGRAAPRVRADRRIRGSPGKLAPGFLRPSRKQGLRSAVETLAARLKSVRWIIELLPLAGNSGLLLTPSVDGR
jgi:hypothetical protein